ncbi:uncharacterized protein LOC117112142 [Anneissia japonica]|uniref:uncharacterized protein LOC117112142 n=1 Tax=Anneissia japonica TaxID=1529436 RepID=UPI0014257DE1|nr:uncharacterized protein LOC117112142 [Anneissia japonica]
MDCDSAIQRLMQEAAEYASSRTQPQSFSYNEPYGYQHQGYGQSSYAYQQDSYYQQQQQFTNTAYGQTGMYGVNYSHESRNIGIPGGVSGQGLMGDRPGARGRGRLSSRGGFGDRGAATSGYAYSQGGFGGDERNVYGSHRGRGYGPSSRGGEVSGSSVGTHGKFSSGFESNQSIGKGIATSAEPYNNQPPLPDAAQDALPPLPPPEPESTLPPLPPTDQPPSLLTLNPFKINRVGHSQKMGQQSHTKAEMTSTTQPHQRGHQQSKPVHQQQQHSGTPPLPPQLTYQQPPPPPPLPQEEQQQKHNLQINITRPPQTCEDNKQQQQQNMQQHFPKQPANDILSQPPPPPSTTPLGGKPPPPTEETKIDKNTKQQLPPQHQSIERREPPSHQTDEKPLPPKQTDKRHTPLNSDRKKPPPPKVPEAIPPPPQLPVEGLPSSKQPDGRTLVHQPDWKPLIQQQPDGRHQQQLPGVRAPPPQQFGTIPPSQQFGAIPPSQQFSTRPPPMQTKGRHPDMKPHLVQQQPHGKPSPLQYPDREPPLIQQLPDERHQQQLAGVRTPPSQQFGAIAPSQQFGAMPPSQQFGTRPPPLQTEGRPLLQHPDMKPHIVQHQQPHDQQYFKERAPPQQYSETTLQQQSDGKHPSQHPSGGRPNQQRPSEGPPPQPQITPKQQFDGMQQPSERLPPTPQITPKQQFDGIQRPSERLHPQPQITPKQQFDGIQQPSERLPPQPQITPKRQFDGIQRPSERPPPQPQITPKQQFDGIQQPSERLPPQPQITPKRQFDEIQRPSERPPPQPQITPKQQFDGIQQPSEKLAPQPEITPKQHFDGIRPSQHPSSGRHNQMRTSERPPQTQTTPQQRSERKPPSMQPDGGKLNQQWPSETLPPPPPPPQHQRDEKQVYHFAEPQMLGEANRRPPPPPHQIIQQSHPLGESPTLPIKDQVDNTIPAQKKQDDGSFIQPTVGAKQHQLEHLHWEDQTMSDTSQQHASVPGSDVPSEGETSIDAKKPITFCEICNISVLTSWNSHCESTKHLKKLQSHERMEQWIVSSMNDAIETDKITSVDQKIRDCKEPLIGLQYLIERNDPDAPITFVCMLCSVVMTDVMIENALFPHLLGSKHRLNYINKHYAEYSDSFYRMNSGQEKLSRKEKTEFLCSTAKMIEGMDGRGKVKVMVAMKQTGQGKPGGEIGKSHQAPLLQLPIPKKRDDLPPGNSRYAFEEQFQENHPKDYVEKQSFERPQEPFHQDPMNDSMRDRSLHPDNRDIPEEYMDVPLARDPYHGHPTSSYEEHFTPEPPRDLYRDDAEYGRPRPRDPYSKYLEYGHSELDDPRSDLYTRDDQLYDLRRDPYHGDHPQDLRDPQDFRDHVQDHPQDYPHDFRDHPHEYPRRQSHEFRDHPQNHPRDHSRDFRDHPRDQSRDFRDHPRDQSRDFRDHPQDLRDRPQDLQDLPQDFRDYPQELRDHPQDLYSGPQIRDRPDPYRDSRDIPRDLYRDDPLEAISRHREDPLRDPYQDDERIKGHPRIRYREDKYRYERLEERTRDPYRDDPLYDRRDRSDRPSRDRYLRGHSPERRPSPAHTPRPGDLIARHRLRPGDDPSEPPIKRTTTDHIGRRRDVNVEDKSMTEEVSLAFAQALAKRKR